MMRLTVPLLSDEALATAETEGVTEYSALTFFCVTSETVFLPFPGGAFRVNSISTY